MPAAGQSTRHFFGQPAGLIVLFLTQMWEQFSYYGMYSLLVLYMTNELHIDQKSTSLVFGIYTSAIYGLPILGGWLADRVLGHRNAVILGSLIMAMGHFMMISPHLLYPALTAIACGTGLFIPSVAGQVSNLYRPGDPRVVPAYNIYYVGTNLGGTLAFVCGVLAASLGWHWGFGIAGLGMLVALATYLMGSRHLPRKSAGTRAVVETGGLPEWTRPDALLLLQIILIIVLFRAAFGQSGNTVLQWAYSAVDRHVAGSWSIPAPLFANLNPLIVLVFGPILAWHWNREAKAGRGGRTMRRMAAGGFLVAAAYSLAAIVAWSAEASGHSVSWPWLVAIFLLLTLGELHTLPVGLSLFGRIAPRRLAATVIAAWFFAGAGGNLLAGALGMLWSEVQPSTFLGLTGLLAMLASLLLLTRDRYVAEMEARALRRDVAAEGWGP